MTFLVATFDVNGVATANGYPAGQGLSEGSSGPNVAIYRGGSFTQLRLGEDSADKLRYGDERVRRVYYGPLLASILGYENLGDFTADGAATVAGEIFGLGEFSGESDGVATVTSRSGTPATAEADGVATVTGVGQETPTLAFEASATSGDSDTITGPSEIQSGDLLALFDVALGTSVPSTVVPSGFSTAQNVDDGSNTRAILSYKIADGSEADASLTGMDISVDGGKILFVFRPSSALSSASHASGGAEITNGNPSSQNVEASNGSASLVVLAGYRSSGSIDPRSFSPAKDDEIKNPDENQWFAYRIDNANPQDTVIDMDDEGDANTLLSTYIEVS